MTWNYVVGFFDGEGSITKNGSGFRITIVQTNKEVLEEIKKFIQLGGVMEITKRKLHWKDCWVYYIASPKDVHIFFNKSFTLFNSQKKFSY